VATVASFSNQWLQIVQLLDLDGVGQLLECLGYGEYRQAFVEADIHGSELSVLAGIKLGIIRIRRCNAIATLQKSCVAVE